MLNMYVGEKGSRNMYSQKFSNCELFNER